jgi:hypothetical protein
MVDILTSDSLPLQTFTTYLVHVVAAITWHLRNREIICVPILPVALEYRLLYHRR